MKNLYLILIFIIAGTVAIAQIPDGHAKLLVRIDSYDYIRWDWDNANKEEYRYEDGLRIGMTSYNYYNNEWMPTLKDSIFYHESDSVSRRHRMIWDFIDEIWENGYEWTKTFDAQNKPIEEIFSVWRDGEWRNTSRQIFTFDENGMLVQTDVYEYFEGEWIEQGRIVLEYDDENRLITRTESFYQEGNWVDNEKFEYTYNEFSQPVKLIKSVWDAGKWNLWQDITYEYISNEPDAEEAILYTDVYIDDEIEDRWKEVNEFTDEGNILHKSTYIFQNGEWVNYDRSRRLYEIIDGEEHAVEMVKEVWLEINKYRADGIYEYEYYDRSDNRRIATTSGVEDGLAVPKYRQTYTYAEFDSLETELVELWDIDAWMPFRRVDYEYNAANQITGQFIHYHSNGDWELNGKILYEYEDGRITIERAYNREQGWDVPVNQVKYEYDENGLLTKRIYSIVGDFLDPDYTLSYKYDDMDRLIEVERDPKDTPAIDWRRYIYEGGRLTDRTIEYQLESRILVYTDELHYDQDGDIETVLEYADYLPDRSMIIPKDSVIYKDEYSYEIIFGAEDNEFTDETNVYPNPAKDVVNIRTSATGEIDYRIVDLSGRVVMNGRTLAGSDGQFSLDVSPLESGAYILNFMNNKDKKAFKIMIQ
ncbi:MAG: T9SS type A sorting domain-containing protein [Candidatus Kapaibacterium sp.]